MPLPSYLLNSIGKNYKLSSVERKTLEALIDMGEGNAYVVWKKTGLKHYPTVLRSTKRLSKKELIKVSSKKGVREGRTYKLTLKGELVSYILNGDQKKILQTVMNNSRLYLELSRVDQDNSWLYLAVNKLLGAFKEIYGEEEQNLDAIIKDGVEGYLLDRIMNPHIDSYLDEIKEIAIVKWVKQSAVNLIYSEISRYERNIHALKILEEDLERK